MIARPRLFAAPNGNTGPLPFIPAAYARNEFGADLRALGAKSMDIAGAAKLNLTFADSSRQNQVMNLLSDTLGGAQLLSTAEKVYRVIPDLSAAGAAKLLQESHLQGMSGAQLLDAEGQGGTRALNIYLQPGYEEHFDDLLKDSIDGYKVNFISAMNDQPGHIQLPSPDSPIQ